MTLFAEKSQAKITRMICQKCGDFRDHKVKNATAEKPYTEFTCLACGTAKRFYLNPVAAGKLKKKEGEA